MTAQVVVCIVVGAAMRSRCPPKCSVWWTRWSRGMAKEVKPAFVLATVKGQFPQLYSALHKNVKKRVSAKKQQLEKKEASL